MAKLKTKRRAGSQPPPVKLGGNAFIVLHTCDCPHCKGRGAACTNAFSWLAHPGDNDHVLAHATADLFGIDRFADGFDGLPASVKDALRSATINVCSRCVSGWLEIYGPAKAAKLIRDVRYIDATRAITPLEGWDSLKKQ